MPPRDDEVLAFDRRSPDEKAVDVHFGRGGIHDDLERADLVSCPLEREDAALSQFFALARRQVRDAEREVLGGVAIAAKLKC